MGSLTLLFYSLTDCQGTCQTISGLIVLDLCFWLQNVCEMMCRLNGKFVIRFSSFSLPPCSP